jgi:hypothetical protein
MAGESKTSSWSPKPDPESFAFPHGPAKLDQPNDANFQVVHLQSKENPFQIVWPHGVSFDTYNGEQSYSMFEWWNHWPVAQVGSSGRPAVAADRASHTSLSHIYGDPYEKTAQTETKLLLCGLNSQGPLLPLAKSWLSPPPVRLQYGEATATDYDPAQRTFVIHRQSGAKPARLVLDFSASDAAPLVNPAFVVENWSSPVAAIVTIDRKKSDTAARTGYEHHLSGDSLILYLPFQSTHPVQISIQPLVQ